MMSNSGYATYRYYGPVKLHGRVVNDGWYAETTATSAAKALSNLCYKYKKTRGRAVGAKITLLPHKLEEVVG